MYTVERICLTLKVINSQAEMCLHYGIKVFRWVLSVYRMIEFCALLSAVFIQFHSVWKQSDVKGYQWWKIYLKYSYICIHIGKATGWWKSGKMPRCFSICLWISLFGFPKETLLQGNRIFFYLYIVFFLTFNVFFYSGIVIFLKTSFTLFIENIGTSYM